MAKVIITLEDSGDGEVKARFEFDPILNKDHVTLSQMYAVNFAAFMREEAEDFETRFDDDE